MTVQAAQGRAADESILAFGEGAFVPLKNFSVEEYIEEEIHVFIGQLIDAEHSLHDMEQQCGYQLLRPSLSCGYCYA